MSLAHYLDRLTRFADGFIPADIAANREVREKARIFLYSHLFGPFIGNTVPLSIWLLDGHIDFRVLTLATSITSFWLFPPLLRYVGHYYVLSVLSVQNLIFCILWSCYFYGGLTSPTVAWVLTIPLLSFMYVGSSVRMRVILIGQFLINTLAYYLICINYAPPHVTLNSTALQVLGLVSTVAASAYVTLMALSYANALASQVELKTEIDQHLQTAADLLAATEDARRSSTAKSDFIAKMSHELRTPLNAIIGYSEILLDDAEDENSQTTASDLRRIRDAGCYLLKLVNKILDYSRIEAGRMEIAREFVDFPALLQSAVAEAAPLAEKNGDKISLSIQGPISLVETDAHKLKLILKNLLENAAQYTQNGEIAVSADRVTRDDRDFVEVKVRDTGPGIKSERLPHLLTSFDSLEIESVDHSTAGAGLGLPLAKKLGDLINAELKVESQIGHGSTFTVTLPVASRQALAETDLLNAAFEQAERGLESLAAAGAAMRAKINASNKSDDNAEVAAG